MIRRGVSILFLNLLLAGNLLAVDDDLVEFVIQNAGNAWVLNEALTEQQRTEIVREIRDSPGAGRFRLSRRALIRANLGDREAVELLYRHHKTIRSRLPFTRITHPRTLQFAGDDVLEKINFMEWDNTFGLQPRPPHSVANRIIAIAATWGEFPPEVREWASGIAEDSDRELPETYLEDARAFWRLNREAILNEEYERVVPPEKRYGESPPPREQSEMIDPAHVRLGGRIYREPKERERQERDGKGDETSDAPKDGA